MNRHEKRKAAKLARNRAHGQQPSDRQSGGLNFHGGTVNTGGGDIVGRDKNLGLNAREVIELLEEKGHLAGLPLLVAPPNWQKLSREKPISSTPMRCT